jgi:predicted type IV restriction endonuclease
MENIITKVKNLEGEKLNEATTIQIIINPILKKFGWDISNSREVMQQPNNNGNGVPDITVKNKDKTLFYIEAKKFDETNLQKHKRQGFSYCYANGVSRLILTNGKEWYFYEVLHLNKSEDQRLFLSINLITETFKEIIQKFNQILKKENYENGTIDQIIKNYFESKSKIDKKEIIKITNKYFKENNLFENSYLINSIQNYLEEKIKMKIEFDEIKRILDNNFEIKGIFKKETQGFNIREKRKKLRDEFVEKIMKFVHEKDPEEKMRTREGEIAFTPGSVEVGFFIRVDTMRKEKKIKFQIIIKKEGENKYRKLVKILGNIKDRTGMELIESNTESRRSQIKNYTFDHILPLNTKESLGKLKLDVIKFLSVLRIIRKEIIEDFMLFYEL